MLLGVIIYEDWPYVWEGCDGIYLAVGCVVSGYFVRFYVDLLR